MDLVGEDVGTPVIRVEGEAFGEAFGSDDAKEGIGAFLGKRRPRFQGR